MLGDVSAPVAEVEDLPPGERSWLAVIESGAAPRADSGRVGMDVVGSFDLPERHPAVSGLAADFHA